MKERCPFTPGHPVPAEYFVGRQKEIERLRRAIEQVALGKNENIFLTGERGIGKSSLASLCKSFAKEQYKLIGTHCFLGGIRSVEELCRSVLQGLLEENPEESFLNKVKTIVGRYIEEIKFELPLFGPKIGFRLKKDPAELKDLHLNFLSIIKGLHQTAKEEYKGFAIILDDLNGATKVPGVSLFLKSFIDELAGKIPLLFCLVGVEERMHDLAEEQPSVTRIFHPVELGLMSNEECKEFYKKAFSSANISIDDDALQLMATYSGGIPTLLHEIGEATFYADTDNKITRPDAIDGIKEASNVVGKKYIDHQVFDEIRSHARRKLLLKVVKSLKSLSAPVRRKEVLPHLTEEEKKDFDNLLRRLTSLGILKKGDERGEYIFLNRLFPVYVRMSLAEKIEKL
ncbi:MAG TPA: BREX system ATP-binding domain-containing protein [Candidatus Hypogeohydataceae bacterium YC41]